jgi:hypothetical protein
LAKTESIKNFQIKENEENKSNFVCIECISYAYTLHNQKGAGYRWSPYIFIKLFFFSFKVVTFYKDSTSKVYVLDDSRVCAEHAIRTRFEVQSEHELSALLDFSSFTFGGNFKECDLQDCFDKLSENSLIFDDSAFQPCNSLCFDSLIEKDRSLLEKKDVPSTKPVII